MSVSQQLVQTTFRIEVDVPGGVSTGTGFLFSIYGDADQSTYTPALITNKHVLRDGTSGRIILTSLNASGELEHFTVIMDQFEKLWRDHPDSSIDLTAAPMGPLIANIEKRGLIPRITCLSQTDVPTPEELDELSFVEDVLMVGYPNGLWDSTNNYPLFRRGITSTHPGKSFQGQQQFVVDIAAFPGSSGSPVFLYNEGAYSTSNGLVMGTRVKILGILYAGPQFTADGRILLQPVPISQTPISRTSIPMNLGFVISSQVLSRFREVLPTK